jgi:hypothetical protein
MPNGYTNEELAEICDACKEPKSKHYPRADWLCPKQNPTYFTSKPVGTACVLELEDPVEVAAATYDALAPKNVERTPRFRCKACGKTFVDEYEEFEEYQHNGPCGGLVEEIVTVNEQLVNSPYPSGQVIPARPHIVDGEFQSDKYPTCPRGKVPLSVKDPMAQDLLWAYALRRMEKDTQFSEDLMFALQCAGYHPKTYERTTT